MSADPRLWSALKYFNNYFMECHKNFAQTFMVPGADAGILMTRHMASMLFLWCQHRYSSDI